MSDEKKHAPPMISPYAFPVLLAGFGLWCAYDGWFTTDPKMVQHQTFNRIAAGVLLGWAVIDFIRTRKREKDHKAGSSAEPPAA